MTATLPADMQATRFDAAGFEALLAARPGEPAWLTERRRRSWEAFEAAPWPSNKDEEWMRTDIRLFKLDKFGPSLGAAESIVGEQPLLSNGVELGGRVEALNGVATLSELDEDLAAQGVVFGGLGEAVTCHSEKLEKAFAREVVSPTYDRFAMLNDACWTGGVVLHVPKGVRIEKPLHAIARMAGAGASDFGKTIIVLEEGAEATLLMETASTDAESAGLHNGTIEIVVGRNAKLRYVNLQNWNNRTWHFAHQKAVVGREGQLQWTIGALGARLAKVNQRVALTGADAEAQVNGAMFTQGKQHLCYNTHQHHEAPYCRSDLLYKNALQDHSRTVWRGMIQVDEAGQRTDAYQRNDNLMLAATARADSIPGLEIEADDVRCTHGSTSGRVDDTMIFYAMSRGYTRQEAVRMIVAGFFQQVFDRITIDSVREALGEAIGQRVQDLPNQ
ncbi:FeS cluster assembly protein SufB [Botrimarina colliarenosi]|uniref:FeS cluster assembly protein SufB n=1 Tax=Botrimarina colliarenosi TaxID=2528001 RepID=A0A5C6AJX0_9BACT|nr:Fe-S cluster assembly protein SufD [Botrimarina colliarenosi]TWT99710.1 FeS cluster assembly protein SufB [Botrimarina colliarenosi]